MLNVKERKSPNSKDNIHTGIVWGFFFYFIADPEHRKNTLTLYLEDI